MKVIVGKIGELVLTPRGVEAVPVVRPEECVVDEDEIDPAVTPETHRASALHRRAHSLKRVMASRAVFNREHPGGTDEQFLRWLVEEQPDIYPMSLVE
jgi:hypothetical protein